MAYPSTLILCDLLCPPLPPIGAYSLYYLDYRVSYSECACTDPLVHSIYSALTTSSSPALLNNLLKALLKPTLTKASQYDYRVVCDSECVLTAEPDDHVDKRSHQLMQGRVE